jgi:acetyltransferase-like isoleucine patch superfamily enzyme
MSKIANTAKILKNVKVGKNVTIEDFVIIGAVPRGYIEGELETIIGDNAVIRSHTVIYAGNVIGNNFQTGNHVSVREKNTVGNNVSIGTKSVVEFESKIGNNVRIHSQVFIPEYSVLEDDCWIGPNVVLTNAKYPKSLKSKEFLKGVIIEKDAIVGGNATILSNVKIGTKALIGAGSVVTKNIPSGKIVAGNPAKIIGDVSDLKYPTGEKAYKG